MLEGVDGRFKFKLHYESVYYVGVMLLIIIRCGI